MKAKQQADQLYSIIDAVFDGVNNSQHKLGTGKMFTYELKPTVDLKDKDALTKYNFTVKLREAGHPERELQTIPFTKPKDYDKFKMETQVLMAVLTIVTETTLLHWDELGKLLNTDAELQEIARNS